MLYYPFHTTPESRREKQPQITECGNVITWDGRLDNRLELIGELADSLTPDSTDLQIVVAAYQRWDSNCFAKLVGDWALAIWNACRRQLILARDFVGIRQLYYTVEKDRITWCTILDPLVLCGSKNLKLSEEYMAGWLGFHPAAHLSPYDGIHGVAPSTFVVLTPDNCLVRKYWDFNPAQKTLYFNDADYEEHFRVVFRDAVKRRLRSSNPMVAELSGGMDSSSIVCMADLIIHGGLAQAPDLHTTSYYDDSEPNWNERPYFSQVEAKRGRDGCHIDVSGRQMFARSAGSSGPFDATPSSTASRIGKLQPLTSFVQLHNIRALLSGLGGDEVMGGVPTPTPEVQDLLAGIKWAQLAHQLKVWALNQRVPWLHLLFEAIGDFLPRQIAVVSQSTKPSPWLSPDFVRRNKIALQGYGGRIEFFRSRPSFQANMLAVEQLRRQMSCCSPPSNPICEIRYPYLDRDLLEFIYSIPREQLVRPGQRRSLMRRALSGIVPEPILNRKRKAFVARGPRLAITSEWSGLAKLTNDMHIAKLNITSERIFLDWLQRARNNGDVSIVRLMRTVYAELWLRNLGAHGLQLREMNRHRAYRVCKVPHPSGGTWPQTES